MVTRPLVRSFAIRGLCLIGVFIPSVQALDPAKTIFQFNCQNWSRSNGLPAGKINTVTQTADGYIWLGTQNGLVRFDGLEFKLIPTDFPSAHGREIRKLASSRAGGLLLAINNGGFARYRHGKFEAIIDPGWPESISGKDIVETRDGAVWIATNLGIGRAAATNEAQGDFTSSGSIRAIVLNEDSDGRIWAGMEGAVAQLRDGLRTEIADPSMAIDIVSALASDREGNLWVGMGRELRCYDRAGNRIGIPPLAVGINALLVDQHGVVWIGTDRLGLGRYQNGGYTFLNSTDGLGGDYVTSLFEDAEGSIWAGTRDGLSQLSDLKFPLLTEKEGIVSGPAHTVAPSKSGGLWITTSTGVSYYDGRNSKNFSTGEILTDPYVKLGFETKAGDVYLLDGLRNLNVFSNGKLADRIPNERWPESLGEDSKSVLVGMGSTLWRAIDGELQPYEFVDGKIPDFRWFDNICVSRDDAIWIPGYQEIFRVKDGRYQFWPIGDGSTPERMYYLFEDVDGSMWGGMSSGLVRIKNGQLKKITESDGLHDDRIYAIVPDDHGYFWIDSGRGIFRVKRQQLNDFADERTTSVQCDNFDGLESVKFTDHIDQEYSGCKTADGRIWFPNEKGVVMIDPANYFINRVPPRVHVDQVRVNNIVRPDREKLLLKPRDERVEFFFSALSFISAQKAQVQYRLEGLDTTWTDAGARRSAVYSHLQPGRYTFHVRASNADGIWNDSGATFQLELPPRFYQTGWFFGLCGLFGVMSLAGGYRWKVRHMQVLQVKLRAQNDLLESKVSKRTEELAYERDLLRTLLDSSPDHIYFKDTQSRFVKTSQANATRLGVATPEELVGKTDADFFAAEHAEKALADEQEIIRTGRPVIGKVEREVTADGQVSWVLTTKMPWRDKNGAIVGTFGLSKSISELKAAEDKLAEVHRQLLETSRQAGMAEVATSVLHNVGNVLNSVNVSATLVVDQIRESKASFVPKVGAMLQSHSEDLAAFLVSDSKGRMLPSYLATLGQELLEEQRTMTEELEHLRKNIEHIKEIVAMQQSFAKVSGVAETLALTDLVDDALRINASALSRHHVELVRDYQFQPTLTIDRHKLMQILVNLIRNAKYACDDGGSTDKKIIIRITRREQWVRIAVIDNGVGIPAANLTRIFAHGFTTRKDGHGFGLHSGALVARELGGSLTAESDGHNRGATFTVELPLDPKPTPS